MPMRPAIHTYNWIPWADRVRETLDLERVLAEAREAGYDAVEFSRVPMELDDPARTRRLLKKFALTLTGMSVYYDGTPGRWALLQEDLKICADLGGKMAVFFDAADWKVAPVDSLPAGVRSSAEAAEAFAEFAATLGMDTTFHNHLDTNLETPAQIDDILPRLRRCGFCLDTGHLIGAGGDPVACTRRYGRKIRHVHFKDTAFTPEGRFEEFVELGTGNHSHSVSAWLNALQEVHYDGWLTLEQDQTRTTPLASARANREWLRRNGL